MRYLNSIKFPQKINNNLNNLYKKFNISNIIPSKHFQDELIKELYVIEQNESLETRIILL